MISILSSNVNEVIRAILNSFFFSKRFCTHKKHKKQKKAQKAQKRNQAKAQKPQNCK